MNLKTVVGLCGSGNHRSMTGCALRVDLGEPGDFV